MIDMNDGPIVWENTEFGHFFQVQALFTPVMRGAGMRKYRLYDNFEPACGGQWHYTLADAKARAEYVMNCSSSDRISWLEARVNTLQGRLHVEKDADDERIQKMNRVKFINYISSCYDLGTPIPAFVPYVKPVKEMTIAEIAEALGHNVKVVK